MDEVFGKIIYQEKKAFPHQAGAAIVAVNLCGNSQFQACYLIQARSWDKEDSIVESSDTVITHLTDCQVVRLAINVFDDMLARMGHPVIPQEKVMSWAQKVSVSA